MESEVQLNEQGDVQRVYDENNCDVLFCRRAEIFFTPNEDGTPSTEGKVLWHTQWWHYIGNVKRAESLGPVIENSIAQVLGDSYEVGAADPLPAAVIVAGIKAAYTHRAAAHFGIETVADSGG
ncbi:hypothetical protein [Stenotrophomonas sp.]|uniref:hypothetical protein n=1 Tax=Stenotrophomonas sp. TaxID=69392 RepID=UPI0028A93909|nr:hypothetical protein [Stenotrophomonas sp.]